jgi:S-adenosylmethionine-dependent methyltransferase
MLATARDRAMTAGLDVQFIRGGIEDLRELDPFDAVLCHFVVQYRDDLVEDVGRLVSATRPGGLLSVIAPNPASIVITRLLRQGPADALAELERDTARTVTFDHEVRKVPFADVERHLNSQGCEVVGRYGGRIANDLISDNALKHEPDYYADLGRLELALCDQEPFWRFGNFWQLVAQTPPPDTLTRPPSEQRGSHRCPCPVRRTLVMIRDPTTGPGTPWPEQRAIRRRHWRRGGLASKQRGTRQPARGLRIDR